MRTDLRDQLTAVIESSGRSHAAIAEEAGVHRSMISQILAGRSDTVSEKLAAIAEAAGGRLAILGASHVPRGFSALDDRDRTAILALVEALPHLDPGAKESLHAMIAFSVARAGASRIR